MSKALLFASAAQPQELASPTIIGSDPRVANIVFDDVSVAPLHAVVERDGREGWRIRNLASGETYVDGSKVHDPFALSGTHEIQVGRIHAQVVIERDVTLVMHAGGEGTLARDGVEVILDPLEMAFIRGLADTDGFVRAHELTPAAAPTRDHASAAVRYLARRLERRLAILGPPAVLEVCERRGYRLRALLVAG